MKPVAKRVTIQKPEQKRAVEPCKLLPGGFTRVSEVKIRKVYGQSVVYPGAGAVNQRKANMGDSNPKNNQKKKAQQSAKKVSNQKKPAAASVPTAARKK